MKTRDAYSSVRDGENAFSRAQNELPLGESRGSDANRGPLSARSSLFAANELNSITMGLAQADKPAEDSLENRFHIREIR
jgi:hypothetical protein